jgi:arylsulfatase
VDLRSGVNDQDYQVPFRFTGTLEKITYKLEPPSLSAADQKALEDAKKVVASRIQ